MFTPPKPAKLHAVEQPLPKTFISDAEKENRPLVNRHDSGAKVLDVDEVIRRSERLPDERRTNNN
jgi:hypothetical protein